MASVIGVCGLGDMGAVIVLRLLGAGYDVISWNRTAAKAKPLLDAGMRWAPTELFPGCKRVQPLWI